MDNKSLAILGFVLSFFIPLVSLIICIVAMNNMKKAGEVDGKGFAIAGIVINIVYFVIVIAAVACVVCAAGMATAGGLTSGY